MIKAISLRLEQTQYERLRALSLLNQKPVAQIIQEAIDDHLQKQPTKELEGDRVARETLTEYLHDETAPWEEIQANLAGTLLPLVLEPQPEGGYTITSPLVPGLVTEADTLDEVLPHVADALAALLELYEDLGQPLPPALRSLPLSNNAPTRTEAVV